MLVIPGLVPGIHASARAALGMAAQWRREMDGRDQPGHDERD